MIKILKILISYISVKIGIVNYLIKKNNFTLSYHNVIPDKYFDNAYHLVLSHMLSTFIYQIGVILNYRKKNNLPGDFKLSFDDGYLNNFFCKGRDY